MSQQHEERPSGALAHGPAKSDDIRRVRHDVRAAEERAARSASRYWNAVMLRAVRERAS
ncbi:MAG: hypothetical protein QOD55_1962 [Solirubrobacteraceae bacterium]|jgi:hypothetical protein|nr:hypothetical protein [Solirubrobacteraceae bacterium]MEA2289965.1 hypothetical protein [Solirubrobacteraceae bacterium]